MVKVWRSMPAPESLAIEAKKVSGSYRKIDVMEQLARDFHNKCYLCELKGLQDPEVEHLLPHQNGKYADRKFDWNNLFLTCRHCNLVKNQSKYNDTIIDCCVIDPEERLFFGFERNEVNVLVYDENDDVSCQTAELVSEVFNLKNTGIRIMACQCRINGLAEEMNKLYCGLRKYRNNPDSIRNKRTLEVLLKRSSAFAAFKRCYVRKHIKDYPGLEALVSLTM